LKDLSFIALIICIIATLKFFLADKKFHYLPVNWFSFLYAIPMLITGAILTYFESYDLISMPGSKFSYVSPSDHELSVYYLAVMVSIVAIPIGATVGRALIFKLINLKEVAAYCSAKASIGARIDLHAALLTAIAGTLYSFHVLFLTKFRGLFLFVRGSGYTEILTTRTELGEGGISWVHYLTVYEFMPLVIIYFTMKFNIVHSFTSLTLGLCFAVLWLILTLSLSIKYPIAALTVALSIVFLHKITYGDKIVLANIKWIKGFIFLVVPVLLLANYVMLYGARLPNVAHLFNAFDATLFRLFSGGESYDLLYGIVFYSSAKISFEMLDLYNVSKWVSIAVEGRPEWAFGRAGPSMMYSYAKWGLLSGLFICIAIHTVYGALETILIKHSKSEWLRSCLILLMASAFWPWAGEGRSVIDYALRPFSFCLVLWLILGKVKPLWWHGVVFIIFLYYLQGFIKNLVFVS